MTALLWAAKEQAGCAFLYSITGKSSFLKYLYSPFKTLEVKPYSGVRLVQVMLQRVNAINKPPVPATSEGEPMPVFNYTIRTLLLGLK